MKELKMLDDLKKSHFDEWSVEDLKKFDASEYVEKSNRAPPSSYKNWKSLQILIDFPQISFDPTEFTYW